MTKTTDEAEGDGLTDWELRRKNLAKQAFREVLTEFGLDPDTPLEIQKDMAHLRRQRLLTENAFFKIISAIITVAVPGAIALLVAGAQGMFRNG